MSPTMASAVFDPPPRKLINHLSIGHLLLWTAGSALVLAHQRVMLTAFETETEATSRLRTAVSVFAVLYCLPAGAGVAGSILWGFHRFFHRTAAFPVQPGHWLLAVSGLVFVAHVLASATAGLIDRALEYTDAGASVDVDLVRFAAQIVPPAAASVLGCCITLWRLWGEGRLWRAAILFFLAQSALGLLLGASALAWAVFSSNLNSDIGHWAIPYSGVNFGLGLVGGLLILVAAIFDPRRRERDFLHWTGIVALLGSDIAS